MSFEISGKLVKKYDTESKTATFQTREFVIVTEETYPQYIKFQLSQERVNLIEPFEENDVIRVSFDLRGREWQGKYFTNLNAFRIQGAGNDAPNVHPGNDIPFEIDNQSETDLPF
ncbi:MAG: DUF3127 domain-containing protein [Saprospiraceae bacterium]|nr:DUF3127 domain-containing protein [Saprospiraceae bacterium]